MFNRCKKNFGAHKIGLAIVFFTSLLGTLLGLIPPYLTGSLITDISQLENIQIISNKCLILILLFFIGQLLNIGSGVVGAKVETIIAKEFNCEIIFHVQSLSYLFLQQQNKAALNQAINQDANTVVGFYVNVLINVLRQSVLFIVLLIVCYIISPEMAAVLILSTLLYIAIYISTKKILLQKRRKLRNTENDFFAKLFEQLEYDYFIKSNAIESAFRQRLNPSFDKLLKAKVEDTTTRLLVSFVQSAITIFTQCTVIILGAVLVSEGNLTIGLLLTFSNYSTSLQSAAQYFLSLGSSYQNAKVSSDRIEELYLQKEETQGSIKLSKVTSIICRDLSFTFSSQSHLLLNGLNFDLKVGNIYGVFAENGKGKTTLLNILLGLYNERLPKGHLYFNHTDIKDIDTNYLRKNNIAYLSQANAIIPGSYNENITMLLSHKKSIDSEKIQLLTKLLTTAQLHNKCVISKESLSGGESRKLCIIRSLLKNGNILILDEPDASLDEISCKNLMLYLISQKQNKIIIIVSHNEYVLNQCDALLHLL